LHGANRLGANSTANAWSGRYYGAEIAKYLKTQPPLADLDMKQVDQERIEFSRACFSRTGRENPYEIKEELRRTMDQYVVCQNR